MGVGFHSDYLNFVQHGIFSPNNIRNRHLYYARVLWNNKKCIFLSSGGSRKSKWICWRSKKLIYSEKCNELPKSQQIESLKAKSRKNLIFFCKSGYCMSQKRPHILAYIYSILDYNSSWHTQTQPLKLTIILSSFQFKCHHLLNNKIIECGLQENDFLFLFLRNLVNLKAFISESVHL